MAISATTSRTPLMILGIVIIAATLTLLTLARQSSQLGTRYYTRSCAAAARENNRIDCWQAYTLIDATNYNARQQCSRVCNSIGLVPRKP